MNRYTLGLAALGGAGLFWAWMFGLCLNSPNPEARIIAVLPGLPLFGVIGVMIGVWRGKIR